MIRIRRYPCAFEYTKPLEMGERRERNVQLLERAAVGALLRMVFFRG